MDGPTNGPKDVPTKAPTDGPTDGRTYRPTLWIFQVFSILKIVSKNIKIGFNGPKQINCLVVAT